MQIECRTTSLLDCYAEMQLILCKGKKINEEFRMKREDFYQIGVQKHKRAVPTAFRFPYSCSTLRRSR